MRPTVDKIGLLIFQPATSIGNRCDYPPSNNANYDDPTYPYAVVNLTNDFRLSDNKSAEPEL